DQPADACTLIEGTGPHLLLIGDSHAGMMIPTLRAIARTHNLTLSVAVRSVCPWQRHLFVRGLAGLDQRIEDCERDKDDLYDRVIPDLDPDVIVAMNRGYEVLSGVFRYVGPDRQPFENGSPALEPWLETNTVSALQELRAEGRRVVLLKPVPYPAEGFNTLACLSQATVVEECRYAVEASPPSVEPLYDRLDGGDEQAWSVDLDQLICPFLPVCDPIIDGVVVTTDGTHLTRTYARSLGPALAQFLQQNGIIPGADE
ncbi:MAG: SGNH hydrolase domain-containing protein, partial [Acidimicrobiales bacterium]